MRREKVDQELSGFKIEDLRAFADLYVHVAKGRTIREAAKLMNKSYPGLITLLSELEMALGFDSAPDKRDGLIKRPTTGKVSPTRDGDKFYEAVKAVLRRLDDTCQELRSGRERVRIMGTDFCVNFLLPVVFKQFALEHPLAEVIIQQGDWISILDAVQGGSVDLGFAFLNTYQTRKGIIAERLGTLGRKLFCAKGHDFKAGKPRSKSAGLTHLRGETLLCLAQDIVPSTRVEDIIREEHPGWCRFLYLPTLSHISTWVKHDLGIAIGYYDYLEPGDEFCLDIYDIGFPQKVEPPFACLYYREDRTETLPPPVSSLMRLLRERLSETRTSDAGSPRPEGTSR